MIQFGGITLNFWIFFLLYIFVPTLIFMLVFRPKEFCLSRIEIIYLAFLLLCYGLVGARILHVILYYERSGGAGLDQIWKLSYSGFSSPGAIVFGLLTLHLYSRLMKKSSLEVNDYFTLFFLITVFFMRTILCVTIAGCCYGCPVVLPWAMTFPVDDLTRHPTQVYEIIYTLALFITALRYYSRLSRIRGATFFSIYFGYFFLRFFNEFLRVDSPPILGVLRLSNVAMIAGMALCGTGIYIAIFKKGKKQEFLILLPMMVQMFLLSLVVIGFIILGLLTIF
mgnify:CR=1 FL=1